MEPVRTIGHGDLKSDVPGRRRSQRRRQTQGGSNSGLLRPPAPPARRPGGRGEQHHRNASSPSCSVIQRADLRGSLGSSAGVLLEALHRMVSAGPKDYRVGLLEALHRMVPTVHGCMLPGSPPDCFPRRMDKCKKSRIC